MSKGTGTKANKLANSEISRNSQNSIPDVTLSELLRSQGALQMLAGQVLPVKEAFKLSKIIKAVARELEICDETRTKLCQQYGVLNPDKNEYEFASFEKRATLDKEYTELIKMKVSIEGERLSLDKIPNLTISAGDLLLLSWLIND